ncbi:MAG: TonB-dependent receptor [Chitinophagales bacterium]|nr:TonB-dependent receptor [Bacteroidota bacterium]MCB9257240.1 TonB-dependent receptor [Chitinophagales bacterium]
MTTISNILFYLLVLGIFALFPSFSIAQDHLLVMDSILSEELSEVVVTGSKTFKRKTESSIIVNVLDSKTLDKLQVCNLSEGLKFQPGLRIETDCQTCNYTQLRMNGLTGSYSQILINGRPIFSPLMGLYGLEQLPANMIDRIEIVRGGGSSLYGSSAIGGTVNVITKLPTKNSYEINSFYQNINGQTSDFHFNANINVISKLKNTGTSFFINKRNREFYDANHDNFSELPKLNNTALGLNSFYKPKENQKLEIALSYLYEYRLGGEITDKPAFQSQQAEERYHNIWMGSADYQVNFNNYKSSLILYAAFQNTQRKHYTGILPDSLAALQEHIENPPYGNSRSTTIQGGMQVNHELNNFLKHRNVLSFGTEFISDQVIDEIASYHYSINQGTRNWGSFVQSDWDFAKNFNLLSGLRMDKHNLLNKLIFSPRLALLYTLKKNTQFRFSYGTGFRAPQAFDTDLHIAFAGGGISRVQLSPELREERSQSISTSINFDKASKKWIAGFTVEGFYTKLKNSFVLKHIGQDAFGEVFEKSNDQDAIVGGLTVELRANYNKKMQLESGFTIQKTSYKNPVEYIQGTEPSSRFLRSPNAYGFANLNFNPTKNCTLNLNYVFTGKMQIAHFGGAENFPLDKMVESSRFSDWSSKIAYTFHLLKLNHDLELYGGIKNILNAYQNDFDTGKNRDSNYVYGPSTPRTYYLGIKLKSL